MKTPPPEATKTVYPILRQIVNLIPPNIFHAAASATKDLSRVFTPCSHAVALIYQQLTKTESLNGVCDAARVHASQWQELRGAVPPRRNTFSNANQHRDPAMMESLYWAMKDHLGGLCPEFVQIRNPSVLARFRKRHIHLLDSSTIQLVLNSIDWARHRARKAAAKLHMNYMLGNLLPSFAIVEDAGRHDSVRAEAATANLGDGDILVADRAYTDFGFLNALALRHVFFVVREKTNLVMEVVETLQDPVEYDGESKSTQILKDEIVRPSRKGTAGKYTAGDGTLRRVTAMIEVRGQMRRMVFFTNNLEWSAKTVAELYRARWAVELFFKELKQTCRLQYASATEVSGQINELMSREVGPAGKLLPVAVANAEANTVTVMAAPDKVAACGRIVSDVDRKPKQVYVEARFVALSSSAARNLGLKWDMLRSGVGVKNAQVGGGFMYQHIPDGVTKYSESVGGRGSSYSGNYEFDTKTSSRSMTTTASSFDAKNNKIGETVSKVESSAREGIWANTSYFQGTISSSDMSLLLQAFDDDSQLKTFANPKIIVSSGKEATVDIATKSPYVEISAKRVVGDKNNTLDVDAKLSAIPGKDATFSGEVFFSFGIELKVLPRVLTNGLVNVVITPSITSLDPSANVVVRPSASESSTDFNGMDIPQMTYPGIDMQRIITEFTMKSGETAVIGGMTRAIEQDQEDGIPYLRAIPWIGKLLFGSTSKVKSQEDVLVFVTVGEVDPEGVKGATGAPAGSTAAKKFPEGLRTKAR